MSTKKIRPSFGVPSASLVHSVVLAFFIFLQGIYLISDFAYWIPLVTTQTNPFGSLRNAIKEASPDILVMLKSPRRKEGELCLLETQESRELFQPLLGHCGLWSKRFLCKIYCIGYCSGLPLVWVYLTG